MPTAFFPVLLLATPVLPPAVCGGDHAALHPAEADLYYACPDLPALVAAYDGAALVRILRDPELVAAVAALSEGSVQLADFDAASVWEKLLAEVPPEVVALGVPDALKDLAAVSWSLHVPPDLAARMEALAPLIEGELALRAVVEQVEQQQFWTDALPADLGFLESTDDPWGRPWTYALDGAGGFVVGSFGADGEPGGEGAAADLTSGVGRLESALSGAVREFRMQLVLEF
ncbi:MAG TPA: type II secretion system protein GspG, partial [Planctomycetota bacterium]|nr:type II secretion system protein GspG [Planctomycetota bacterium]